MILVELSLFSNAKIMCDNISILTFFLFSAQCKHFQSFYYQDNEDEDDDESGDELEHDPAFNTPFEHRIVELKEGSIFKVKYEIYEELGRGRFGVVFKVKDKENGEVLVSLFLIQQDLEYSNYRCICCCVNW